jgi:hypothetical protein
VTDLHVTDVDDHSVNLQWTAPTSTAQTGEAEQYLIHADNEPLNVGSFDSAPLRMVTPATGGPGTVESAHFEGLQPGLRYWFALRAQDHQGNQSPLSNVLPYFNYIGGPLLRKPGAQLSTRTMPSRAPVQIVWQASMEKPPGEQLIRIYDMSGRRLRNFYLGTAFGGTVQWDGLDYRGNAVPPGLYFARLDSNGLQVDARIVLVR